MYYMPLFLKKTFASNLALSLTPHSEVTSYGIYPLGGVEDNTLNMVTQHRFH